jgi:hypothetical protein
MPGLGTPPHDLITRPLFWHLSGFLPIAVHNFIFGLHQVSLHEPCVVIHEANIIFIATSSLDQSWSPNVRVYLIAELCGP